MYSFMNDYSEGAHPKVFELMSTSSFEVNAGYGKDTHCDKAKAYIKKAINREDVDIHFIPGGTQTNLLAISSFLRPHHCAISADTGHINVHETGAIEATGHKILAMPCKDGKLTKKEIKEALNSHPDEHMVKPKLVYISNSTELGTIYTKKELEELHNTCKENELLLYLDGARLGAALTCSSNDMDISDIANFADAFYIGGTKNGALLGEALVIINDVLKEDFRYLMKQRGALMAKGFVLGIQFEALFENNLYFELSKHANKMAVKLAESIKEFGYKFLAEPCTNILLPIFHNDLITEMSKEFLFSPRYKIDDNHTAIRLVTSWATTEESVKALRHFLDMHYK